MKSKRLSKNKSAKPYKNSPKPEYLSRLLLTGHPSLLKIACDAYKVLTPPPDLTISEWADQKRRLSSEASAEPGQWNTDRAPYQREVMDTITDESTHTIVLMWSAQVGKSEIILNTLGYYIDQDPCPILLLQPTLAMAEAFSKDRVSPMIRDTKCLAEKVATIKAKGSENTILHKKFPGGHLTLAGANSPASLASRPIRIVLDDEVDRFPHSAGTEGDPVALAYKRTTTFWNRKQILTSTPTIKGASRIEAAWESSDKRRYFIPCPDCGQLQYLKWAQIKFDPERPDDAYYECEHCSYAIQEGEKLALLQSGRWMATAPFNGTAGFHLNELYSPWKRWVEVVKDFMDAKDYPEKLKVWVNTSLGETWEEKGEGIDSETLIDRVEEYKSGTVPNGAVVLTAAVDVQDDRLECEVVGWGEGYEQWGVDYRVFYGSPAKPEIWQELDDYLLGTFPHESGPLMKIAIASVDSGGHHTDAVYKFCKKRERRRIYAVKGKSQPNAPIAGKGSRKNKANVLLFPIGTDTAKELIYGRLKIQDPGPGYCHFTEEIHDEAYFKGLTCEQVMVKFDKGFARRVWVKPSGARNEPLDLRVYNHAAIEILNPNFVKLGKRLAKATKPAPAAPEPEPMDGLIDKPAPKKSPSLNRKRGGFVGRWRT